MKFIYELKNLIGINCQDIWIFRPSFWHSSQAYFVVVLFFKLFNSLVWATACDSLVNGYETGPCTKLTLQWTNYLLITPLKSSKKSHFIVNYVINHWDKTLQSWEAVGNVSVYHDLNCWVIWWLRFVKVYLLFILKTNLPWQAVSP